MTSRAYNMMPGGVVLSLAACVMIGVSSSEDVWAQIARFAARDPGVRSGSASAGAMVPGLTPLEQQVFGVGREDFQEVASVQEAIPSVVGQFNRLNEIEKQHVLNFLRSL